MLLILQHSTCLHHLVILVEVVLAGEHLNLSVFWGRKSELLCIQSAGSTFRAKQMHFKLLSKESIRAVQLVTAPLGSTAAQAATASCAADGANNTVTEI